MLSKRQTCKTEDHFLYFNIFYLFQLGNSTRCRPEGIEPQTSLTLRDSKPHQFLETASLCFQPWGSIINKKKLPHVCTAVSRKAVQSPLGHFYLSSSTWGQLHQGGFSPPGKESKKPASLLHCCMLLFKAESQASQSTGQAICLLSSRPLPSVAVTSAAKLTHLG